MAVKMVREPSSTPNINNTDDIIPFRYAYGNQNGYVKGRGLEVSHTVNGLNFTLNSGRLVLQGVECDIDSNGVVITIDKLSTLKYYTVYLEVNLALNKAEIKYLSDTVSHPNIEEGDDLTHNSSGTARMLLYRFQAYNGVISEVFKIVKEITYLKDLKTSVNQLGKTIYYQGFAGDEKSLQNFYKFLTEHNVFQAEFDIGGTTEEGSKKKVQTIIDASGKVDSLSKYDINLSGNYISGFAGRHEYAGNYVFKFESLSYTGDEENIQFRVKNNGVTAIVYKTHASLVGLSGTPSLVLTSGETSSLKHLLYIKVYYFK